ncbi:hypothetical protein U1Q18_021345 [Sarracenia purpurea var. burkii]
MMQRFKPSLKFPKSISYSYSRTHHRTTSRHFSTQHTHLPMASLLKTRAVVRFRGPDTVKFLQGLLTNDVRKFAEPLVEKTSTVPTPNLPAVSTSPLYAAVLTPQGRFLYDLFIYRPSRSDQMLNKSGSGPGPRPEELELYADVDSSVLDELLETMKKYRLRSKVDIENVAEAFSCWQRYGRNLIEKSSSTEELDAASVGWGAAVDQSGVLASQGNDLGWQWHKDPRLDCLGFRGIFPSNTAPPLVEADKETDENNYHLWRLEKGIAEGSTEIPKGASFLTLVVSQKSDVALEIGPIHTSMPKVQNQR